MQQLKIFDDLGIEIVEWPVSYNFFRYNIVTYKYAVHGEYYMIDEEFFKKKGRSSNNGLSVIFCKKHDCYFLVDGFTRTRKVDRGVKDLWYWNASTNLVTKILPPELNQLVFTIYGCTKRIHHVFPSNIEVKDYENCTLVFKFKENDKRNTDI